MYVDERKNKNGTITYRITFIDEEGKRRRLSPKKHPKFTTRAQADSWVKTQAAYQEAQRARMEKKYEWRNKFYDFQKLESDFVKWHKKRAPNSYTSTKLYLTYVFDFFLNKKQSGNVNQWNLWHQEFRDWLEEEAKGSKKGGDKLSYSTLNHVIRTFNNFQEFLIAYNHMDPEARLVCECFPQHLVGKRSWEDVITEEEFDATHERLQDDDADTADFFYVAYWTGMRFSELRGLPMAYLYGGQLEGPIAEELKKHGIKHYGYIVLESQLAGKAIERIDGHKVDRKPLKGKRTISPENARTIPILDKECWNILARRYKAQDMLIKKQTFGADKANYLLFDGLSMSQLNRSLKAAQEAVGLNPKSYHCCRHSRATYLVGETRSFFLGKAMLGHKSDVHEDYIHIFEMIALKARQKTQTIDEIA